MKKTKLTLKDKMKLESEHTKSKPKQKKIVIQHEKEHGAGYYPALIKMEAKLKKRGKK
jgi:hypothetical protein